MRLVKPRFQFKWYDLWLGVFVGREKYPKTGGRSRRVFICLVPTLCFSFRIEYSRRAIFGYNGGDW